MEAVPRGTRLPAIVVPGGNLAGEPAPGVESRRVAVAILDRVRRGRQTIDDALTNEAGHLDERDRSLVSAIVHTAMRHWGEITTLLEGLIARPLPASAGATWAILATAAAQLLFLRLPPHAVIDTAVGVAKGDRNARHFSTLINAVLRRVSEFGSQRLESLDGPVLNTPAWAWSRWVARYGGAVARQIAVAHQSEAALDVTPKSGAAQWGAALGGVLLPNGSVRLGSDHQSVGALPGFAEGAWWVQDVAASLPARLLGDLRGKSVIDLCAAPGGKTMQLAAAGAVVTAVDRSAARLERLQQNMTRTGLRVAVMEADTGDLPAGSTYDAVLLDAPCTSTGTIRRHPELLAIKDASQIMKLARVQQRMLAASSDLVVPGGVMVYCTCSLEPEEGEFQVDAFLENRKDFVVEPVCSGEAGIEPHMISSEGYLRTLPHMRFGTGMGMDGFFAARLRRLS